MLQKHLEFLAANNKTTYRERLWLLERGLYSASARARDGAVLGLAFLNDPLAVEPLKAAIKREINPELRQDMEQVLAQLEGDNDGISSKKIVKRDWYKTEQMEWLRDG